MTVPKRRWFAFSLRTMFVGVTMYCVAIGWWMLQIRIEQERKEMLKQIWDRGGIVYGSSPVAIAARGVPLIPIWRRWLGDKQQHIITIKRDIDPDKSAFFERAQRLFPEARLTFGLAESEVGLQPEAYRRRAEEIEVSKKWTCPHCGASMTHGRT